MSDPFIAEIRIFANSFAPRFWATCDGQQLSISQNVTLYSLLGTTYGGDGVTKFNLPNFGGRVGVGQGQGPGLTSRPLGSTGGETTHLLNTSEMASHPHPMMVVASPGNTSTPNPGTVVARAPGSNLAFQTSAASPVPMNGQVIGGNGGNDPHNNMQPYLTLLYAIALMGEFPLRP